MGACLSSDAVAKASSTCAFVVSIEGELIQYPTPIFVSDLLAENSSSFVCNSDALYYDLPIPSLDSDQQLEAGQIYFILPKTMLARNLTASDMAALALKASLALDNSMPSHKTNKSQISPFLMEIETTADRESNTNDKLTYCKKQQIGGTRSRKMLARSSSKKAARMAVRSFSMRLATIYENDDLLTN